MFDSGGRGVLDGIIMSLQNPFNGKNKCVLIFHFSLLRYEQERLDDKQERLRTDRTIG
jgi:hypothetical protein